MAQSRKRGRPPAASRSTKKPPAPHPIEQPPAKAPRRREVLAVICFILAAFSLIGFWAPEGDFIELFVGLIKGLVGYGFYALPPALLFCAVILTFHRGRPVRLRVTCVMLLTVLTGAFFHLFMYSGDNILQWSMFAQLWESGTELQAGGSVSGSISEVFKKYFGFAGTLVVLTSASLLLIMASINKTIAGIVDAYRNRERREYIPEPEPAEEYVPEKYSHLPPTPIPLKRSKNIDIPLDDAAAPPISEFFPKKVKDTPPKNDARVKTPGELISEYAHADDTPDSAEKDAIEDLPLDIPFMERRKRGGSAAGLRNSKEKTAAADTEQPKPVRDMLNDSSSNDETNKNNQTESRTAAEAGTPSDYLFPPVSILSLGTPKSRAGDDEVRVNSERLEAAFRSFGVNVDISNATRGPAVTRYEAELEPGIKLSKLTGLADDIALSLGTSGVRIAAMPNKISTVGIEVPNRSISKVCLRDIIESQTFMQAKSKLTFAIGMDISGDAIVGNIAKLPHLLIAGTTGSGKSVCLNSIILSILYKAAPDEVRFIMIDPKMVEFKVYNSIPHLLVPVVTDVKKAAGALQWAVFEMMKRYALFSETNARDLKGYNQIAAKSDGYDMLPQIIVVVDELADLMLTAGKEVEESVCRVAQMGRAAGMHLVIATQSPRADVITGLMKANIPSRISFKVSSALESRIILDAGGNADKLVGNGDMLYAPIGSMKPMRVQGTWVSDDEREKVVKYIKKSSETNYSDDVMHEIDKAAQGKPSGEKPKEEPAADAYDDLLAQAVDVMFETGQASVSMLQRRLKLGYARAARIVDQMEQLGVVGPFEGSKPRSMLVTKEQWRQMQYLSGIAPPDMIYPDDQDYDDEDA